MRRRFSQLLLSSACALGLLAGGISCPSVAHAADGDKPAKGAKGGAKASALEKAINLEEAGEYELALARFRKINASSPTPEVKFHIALCLEELGRWVKALAMYQTLADNSGDDAGLKSKAEKRAQSLDDRMPMLTVKRGQAPRG